MKKIHRVSTLIQILSDSPNQLYTLRYFCHLFKTAKSSISEDIRTAKEIAEEMGLGRIETFTGINGGVKLVPYVSDENCASVQQTLCDKLSDPGRILGGGFLYTSDLMFDPSIMKQAAAIFARLFQSSGANYVATIETKGIPAAFMTAHLLNLPMIVVRRESKLSEGTTVSINYFSGPSGRIQKMSVAKRAVLPKSKAIIIDDFMRAGGSIKGVSDILEEFDVKTVGAGVIVASTVPEKKKISDVFPLVYLGEVSEEKKTVEVFTNERLLDSV